MTITHDILIVGGGMVGASLACALSGSGYVTAVIESHALAGTTSPPSYDDRTVALSYGSRRILEGIGLWALLADHVTPIDTIHVSQQGRCGITRLHAEQEKLEALGYIIENRLLGQVLYQMLVSTPDIEFLAPATVTAIDQQSDHIRVDIDQPGNDRLELSARLLVGADGTMSAIRQLLGIVSETHGYAQQAIVTNVSTQLGHKNIAYERFTTKGPLALLPMSESRCSLVWTQPESQTEEVLRLDDAEFLRRLQSVFGYRMGRFVKVGKRTAYPLALTQSGSIIAQRAVLVGNAANTLHPVAGQGFNLALRDIATLSELLVQNKNRWTNSGDEAVLHNYVAWRESDIARVTEFTDGLARIFVNPFTPLVHARGIALSLFDKLPPLRHQLARQGMGLSGRPSRLGCGLSLETGDVQTRL